MDAHAPAAATRGLLLRGIDVLTARLDGATELPDPGVLDRATQLNRVLFSQDEDLLAEAKRRHQANRSFAGIIYGHQLRLTIGQAIDDLELLAKLGNPIEFANRVEFIPL